MNKTVKTVQEVKIDCILALKKEYGFAPGVDEIELVLTDMEKYHIIRIENKTYRIFYSKVKRCKEIGELVQEEQQIQNEETFIMRRFKEKR